MKDTTSYSQKEFLNLFTPLLKEQGQLYQKNKNVYARPATRGEKIPTITADGEETKNWAKDKTSFVVKNQTNANEEYIVLGSNFLEKYDFLKTADNGFSEYQSKGKITAIKLTRKLWKELGFPPKQVFFKAVWGEKMVIKLYDYLVSPLDYSEVYRIARKEFWETYRKI